MMKYQKKKKDTIKMWIDKSKEWDPKIKVTYVLSALKTGSSWALRCKGLQCVIIDFLNFADIIKSLSDEDKKRIVGIDMIGEEMIADDPKL